MASDYSYIGSIDLFAGDFAPQGWLICDGRTLQISQYQALYSIIKTTYGGDGKTTFALPDLRGRVPVCMGQRSYGADTYVLGKSGGQENISLTVDNMTGHSHNTEAKFSLGAITNTGDSSDPTDKYPAKAPDGLTIYRSKIEINNKTKKMWKDTVPITISSADMGAPLNLMQPYQVLNFIICANEGIYPQKPRDVK